jgi:hypothetical protein
VIFAVSFIRMGTRNWQSWQECTTTDGSGRIFCDLALALSDYLRYTFSCATFLRKAMKLEIAVGSACCAG